METLELNSKDPLCSLYNSTNDLKLKPEPPEDDSKLLTTIKSECDDNKPKDSVLPPLPLSEVPEGKFPYYGCTICNISYLELKELDQHIVTTHKNRMTSWDFQVQKKIKKKKERKLQKMKSVEKLQKKKEEKPKTEEEKCLEKIYKCASCFKQFALSYYLKLHVRSHTGEKPYQCAECGVAFITASKLGRHRRMHTECKFECRICHKLFSRFDTLTKHFDKKHSEEKLEGEPYDYNAILPYLKELENEVRKIGNGDLCTELKEDSNKEIKIEDEKPLIHDIKIERFDLKMESSSFEVPVVTYDSLDGDVFTETCNGADVEIELKPDVKNEDVSDNEDYFPIDAWTTPHFDDIKDDIKSEIITERTTTRGRKRNISKDEEAVQDPMKCEICSKLIKTPTYYRIHMRTHTGERPFKCYICNKGFITSSKMNRHILTHMNSENKLDTNSVDVISGEDGSNIKKPKKRKTRKRKTYIDTVLKTVAKQTAGSKKRRHVCEFCNKKFLHVETLNVHRQTHNGATRQHICHFCLLELESEDLLKDHLSQHGGANPYVCTICNKSYKRKETMIYHRKTHDMEKKYQCDVCSKSFLVPCKLQRHLLTHRPDKFVVRYECPVCAHIFNTKYHIEMHLTTHEKDGLIQPENRGEVLAMVQQNARKIPLKTGTPNLTEIKDLMPMDERSRICNICGEIFNHFYYLEEHLKTHGTRFNSESDIRRSKLEDAEKRYKCEVCNKGFKLHYYLKLHSFTHTKEKPFMCQQCGKGFITKGKLKRHMESHTGLKKFQCHICYKFFTRPSYLRIHVKTIHGVAKEMFLDTNFYRGC